MIELIPKSPLWHWYAEYLRLGGAKYKAGMTTGELTRRLLIWAPVRWIFSAQNWSNFNRFPPFSAILVAFWAYFDPIFWLKVVLFVSGMLVYKLGYRAVQYWLSPQQDAQNGS